MAVACAAARTALFLVASGIEGLAPGRVVSGGAAGFAIGTAVATLLRRYGWASTPHRCARRGRSFMISGTFGAYMAQTARDHETEGGGDAALGKAMTSRMVGAPASSMHTRSQPNAMPPCGGGPYLNASSRNPNWERASAGERPITSNTACCIADWKIRMDPPPISDPLHTMS